MPRWAQLVVCVMLVAPFVVMVLLLVRHHRRLRVWTGAEATVVDVRTTRSSDGDGRATTTSTVTYRFHDAAGTERHGQTVNPDPVLRRGETVPVVYEPGDPDRSAVVGSLWRHHMALGVFFLLFVPGVLGLLGVWGP